MTVDHYYENEDSLPDDVRFSTAVAGFGQILGGGLYTGEFGYEDVIELAKAAIGDDQFRYRNEFIQLVRSAEVAESFEQEVENSTPEVE